MKIKAKFGLGLFLSVHSGRPLLFTALPSCWTSPLPAALLLSEDNRYWMWKSTPRNKRTPEQGNQALLPSALNFHASIWMHGHLECMATCHTQLFGSIG